MKLNDKKEKTAQAIARAKTWAEKRRKLRQGSGGSAVVTSVLQHQQQQQREVQKITILTEMLKKEKRVLEETKLKVNMIENELEKLRKL